MTSPPHDGSRPTARVPLPGGYGQMRLIDLGGVLLNPWRVARGQHQRESRGHERRETDRSRL